MTTELKPFGLPMCEEDLNRHYENSKFGVVNLVGSEVRQLIAEIRYHRKLAQTKEES